MAVQVMTLGQIVGEWRQSRDRIAFFEQVRRQINPVQLSALLTTQFGLDDLDWVLDTLFEIDRRKTRRFRAEPKTIGIYYPRFFNGGVEKFLSLIMPLYVRMGYRVVFFTDVIDEQHEYFLDQHRGGEIKRIVLRTDPNDLIARLTELASYVMQFKIDLFCSHSVTKILPTVLLFKFLDIPIVLGLHNIFTSYVASRHPFLQPRELNHKIYRLADGLVVLSRVFETFWRNIGCKAHYIPDPIPNDVGDFKRNPLLNRQTILWVGRLVEPKGVRAIVPIMQEVAKRLPNAKLRVLGGISDEELFRELVGQIKAARPELNIEFCGYHLDVRKFYEEADVMLSTSPAEGFSLTIAESKLFALPLVCYELPYLELLRERRGYIGVRQGDAVAAASAIVDILSDEQLRMRMSLEARQTIEPFLNYDLAGAWRNVFNSASNVCWIERNFEVEQLELLLMKEIWRNR